MGLGGPSRALGKGSTAQVRLGALMAAGRGWQLSIQVSPCGTVCTMAMDGLQPRRRRRRTTFAWRPRTMESVPSKSFRELDARPGATMPHVDDLQRRIYVLFTPSRRIQGWHVRQARGGGANPSNTFRTCGGKRVLGRAAETGECHFFSRYHMRV